MSDTVIFSATNHHAEAPPAWVAGSSQGRRGYFENDYGEQWIAEATTDDFRFTGGDIGWKTITVARPDYRHLLGVLDSSLGRPGAGFEGVILGASEKQWLRAVLMSAALLSG